MKVTMEEHFTSASGRACKNSQTYNRTNHHTGQVVVARLCNPYQGPATEKQTAVRAKMAQRAAVAREWRAQNAPTPQNPKGTAEFQALYKLWQADHRYPNWYSKLLTYVKDGKVPSFLTASSPATPPADDDPDSIE